MIKFPFCVETKPADWKEIGVKFLRWILAKRKACERVRYDDVSVVIGVELMHGIVPS